jgi:hypothetical protein
VNGKIGFHGMDLCRIFRYEEIVVGRDVVFLKHTNPDPENVALGAPDETYWYTGMLQEKDGDRFVLSYFSMAVTPLRRNEPVPELSANPHYTVETILADRGGCGSQLMTLDRENMTFWKMGELYIEQGEATKTAER